MTNVQPSAASAALTSAASAGSAKSTTLGQSVDAEIAIVKSRLAQLESAGKADWTKAVAWVKGNWAHIILTYPAAATILAPVVKAWLKVF